jgi:hypothetical protein
MKITLAIAALLLGQASIAQPAVAAEPTSPAVLNGVYVGTGTDNCLVSTAGFDSFFQPIPGGTVYSEHFASLSKLTFNGSGGGTIIGETLLIIPPPVTGFLPSASTNTFRFSITYAVYSDGSVTLQMVPGTFSGSVLNGTLAGLSLTIDQEPVITGLMGRDGLLVVTTLTPLVETVTFPTINLITPRICYRSHVYSGGGPSVVPLPQPHQLTPNVR